MMPESCANDVREFANRSPAYEPTRAWRISFSLRTLLLAPILVGVLLLCVFPKLVTGDYAKVTITNIRVSGGNLRIEMATTISAGTGYGANIPADGVFGSLCFGGDRKKGWIPTWPKQGLTVISFGLRDGRAADGSSDSLLAVKVGETYCATPAAPLKLEATQVGFGGQDKCTLQVRRGSRSGF